jgi:energy-coupling factor transporter ATP-binding protein EcfA2
MMTFRKLAAASSGRLLRAYFTENTPEPSHDIETLGEAAFGDGGRLTAYYTGRDSRATWRPDMPASISRVLGINPTRPPRDAALDRLFEAKRADNGEAWSEHPRKISAFDFTVAPHKSVTLAAEFAETPAEAAAIWHAIDRAGDATMRYVARELGWARKGSGGEEGADPGAVGWVAFRHHTARPTLHVQDGPTGTTYLADVPVPGDPHAHIHYALFNVVVTEDGRVGSLDTRKLTAIRVHEFGAYFQARLATALRELGIRTVYDRKEEAFVLPVIPQHVSDAFSKGRRKREIDARAFAERQGLDWDAMPAERKFKILQVAGLAERLAKDAGKNDREIWREQARALGWRHETVLENVAPEPLTDPERYERAYIFAARHLAKEFHTAAVIDHDKFRMYAARGLIQAGIGRIKDIDRVVERIEHRGIRIRGEQAALIVGLSGDTVRVTQTPQLRIEEDVARRSRAVASRRGGALSVEAVTTAIELSGLDFDREPDHGAAQKAAIYALGTGGNLVVLTGAAGAGKTTLLKPLVSAYQADTRIDPKGRDVIGLATAWRQAHALRETGIRRTYALSRFLRRVSEGDIMLSENNVLVIDEISQIAPRPFLKLLELQTEFGFAIKGLGDREQVQAIEAGDTIEILRRVLPKAAMPALLTTVRQETARAREIAGLFREERAAEALEMKREDGTALLLGGDRGQVIDQIADLYMARRDILTASGDARGITISALTNADAADISRAVRLRLKAHREIEDDEVVYRAIDQRGETYDLPLATGDRIRLFRQTAAQIEGERGIIGSNGDVVEIVGRTENGLSLRDANGRVGAVEWRRLMDPDSDRLLLGFGHALTIDSAQGITSGEHINALPRGTAGITAFKAYTAESRHVTQVWTMISEAAVHEAVKTARPLGDQAPITAKNLWDKVAADMSEKPYKALAMDLLNALRRDHEKAVDGFIRADHRLQTQMGAGRQHGREIRARLRTDIVRRTLAGQIEAFNEAIIRNSEAVMDVADHVLSHLAALRDGMEQARRRIDRAAAAREEVGAYRAPTGPGARF